MTDRRLRSLILVTGYVRTNIKRSIISTPKEILSIVSTYFLTGYPHLILWNGGNENPAIHILNISNGTRHKLSVYDLKRKSPSNFLMENDNKYAGHCIISNTKIPSWPWLQNQYENRNELNNNNNISMIFRFGGRNVMWQSTKLCEMILFPNSQNNDDEMIGFHVKLPSLKDAMSSASYIYNDKIDDNIYCFGGAGEDWNRMNKISFLNLSTLKWKVMKSKMNVAKCFASLCNYNDNIFIIGGYDGQFAKNMEMLNVTDDTIIDCKDMIYDSSSASSLIVGDRIFVVGGLGKQNEAKQLIQIYDINKNEWNILNKKSKYNKNIKYIFNNIIDPNIIYITDQLAPKQHDNTFIEWLDLRDNNKTFQLLHKTANKQLFKLQDIKDLQKVLLSSNHCNLYG